MLEASLREDLVSAITRQPYREDEDAHFEPLMSFDVKEFEP